MFDKKIIPLDKWVQAFIDFLVENYRDVFQTMKLPVEKTLDWLDLSLNYVNPIFMIMILAFIAYRYNGIKLSIFTSVSLVLIGLLGLWEETMTTLGIGVILCNCWHPFRNPHREKQ